MKYLHIRVKGHPNGYYEESKAWSIIESVPQSDVKFLAGTFNRQQIDELRNESKSHYHKPLPVFD